MELTFVILLTAVASALSYVTLSGRVIEVVGGIAGGLTWFLAAYGAAGYTYRTGCCLHRDSAEPVALLFVGFALIMWLVALFGVEQVARRAGVDGFGGNGGGGL